MSAITLRLLGAVVALAGLAAAEEPDLATLKQRVVQRHAAWAQRLYADCEARAATLAAAAAALVERPGDETLAAARNAWIEARRVYGLTEVFRFQDGPIDNARDGVETLLNAWPVDEAYIDAVVGAPASGIVNDPVRFPQLGATVLQMANERGGETNISAGWHAIEFLLWGQDLDPDGPGARSWKDFAPGEARNAARRGEYLLAVVELLQRHLAQVRAQWEPGASNYRARFEAEPGESLRRMLIGIVVLSGFEMSGERLSVAVETHDQEQEHSCFSDTTVNDLVANQRGIAAVFLGGTGDPVAGPGLLELVRHTQPALADPLRRAVDQATTAVAAIPAPFDRAIRAEDGSPAHAALLSAIAALDHQAESFAALGLAWGYRVPLTPGE